MLAYRADEVPVGEDQREHLELMRDIAVRFNARFGEDILVVPKHRIPTVGARVRDLQAPERKMSTTGGSEQGTVYLLDDPATIMKKFKRAVTDSDDPPVIRRGDDKPGVTNLIEILAAVRGVASETVEQELAGARGYGDLKVAVGEAVVAELAPLQERYRALRADDAALEAILVGGSRQGAGDRCGDARRRPRRDGRRPAARLSARGLQLASHETRRALASATLSRCA